MKWRFITVTLGLMIATAVAGAQVKDFTLPSATDRSLIRLSDYAGKVVLINWWRTSCAWSQREAPKLVELYQRYRDRGLVVLGVSAESDDQSTDTVSPIPSYLKRYGITWPIALHDEGEFKRDVLDPFAKGDASTVANYLVTRSGNLTYLGLDRTDDAWHKVEEAVARAIAEPPPSAASIKPSVLPQAPPLNLPDLNGKNVTLTSFSGKPLVVNFFTAQNCAWAGAVLAKMQHDYAAKGLQVIGVDLYDKDGDAQNCVTKYGGTYPVLRGTQAAQTSWIGSSLGWGTFFVTRDGKVLKKIAESVENGHERWVFPWYADYLVTH